jgi:hypothetical protein
MRAESFRGDTAQSRPTDLQMSTRHPPSIRALLHSVMAVFILLPGSTANAQRTEAENVRALALIRQMTLDICPAIDQRSVSTIQVRERRLESGLGSLVGRLVTLNVGGSQRYQRVETRGPLQRQLAELIRSNYDCRIRVLEILNRQLLGPPPQVPVNRRVQVAAVQRPNQSRVSASRPRQTTVAPVAAATKPILRVFLKNNMTSRDVVALAKILPNYDIRLGTSAIDPAKEADTLFVNRDRVSPAEVLEIMRAMAELGVPIKTVQQMPVGGRREVQVGTVIDPNTNDQQFRSVDGLDINALSRLTGPAFWRAAVNGHPFCFVAIGFMSPCALNDQARPVTTAQ